MYTDNNNTSVLKETSTTVSNDKTTFKIGAKASNGKTSGTYENRINFIVTGNAKPLYMQEIDTWRDTLTSTGDAIIATDIRDGNKYWVGKQADGKIWMTQNLDFEITSAGLTSDTSDLTAYNTGGYTSAAGYTKQNGIIKWTPVSTAVTSGRTVPVSTSAGSVSGLTGWANDYYVPYSAEGGDVYVYTSNTTDSDTIYTSLSSCIAASHTEAECKHYHRGNYYNWSAAVASNNTNVTELKTKYDTAVNSICPAGWKLPVGAKANSFSQTNTEFAYLLKQTGIFTDYPYSVGGYSTSYADNGFNNIRSNPLFFVRSGNLYNTSFDYSGTFGYYWSSSVSATGYAYNLGFIDGYVYPTNSAIRSYGYSVRCVARDPIYYMQDVAKWENKIPNTGDSLIAVDKRDGKEYWVGRQADGNIWMTQNLDFEITSEPLTSELTDLTAYGEGTGYTSDAGYIKLGNTIRWTPSATASTSRSSVPISTNTGNISGVTGWTNSYYYPYSAEGGDVYVYTSNSTSADTIYTSLSSCIAASHTEAECKHYHRGNYYNWSAAVASNNTNITELSTRYNTAQNSICPAGWKLPVGAKGDTFSQQNTEFAYLLKESNIVSGYPSYVSDKFSYAAGGFNAVRSNPLFLIRGGFIDGSTVFDLSDFGYYMVSSVSNNVGSYYVYFGSDYIYPAGSSLRNSGFNIRCVARKNINYMQDVAKWENKIPNTGDEITVVDKRDDKEYTVARQADGKIWMTQNLDFEITSEPLTSDTSDLTAYNTGGYTSTAGYAQENGVIKWTPASTAITSGHTVPVSSTTGNVSGVTDWSNSDYAPYSAEGGDVYVYTSNSAADDTIYTSLSSCKAASHTEAECKHYHRGNYYNWSAAVASNSTNVTDLKTNYNTAQNSVCPAGWKLPIAAKASTFSQVNTEFAYLLKQSAIITDYPRSITDNVSYATNGFNNIRSNPLFFARGGMIISTLLYYSGVGGGYWSSSAYSSANVYYLAVGEDEIYPAYYLLRGAGLSIRCVAR